MKVTPTFLIATQARNDLARLTNDLYGLQRQTASGFLADDLKGYGDNAGRIISARGVVAQTEARKAAAERLQVRLDTQDLALSKAAGAAAQLKKDVVLALSQTDGRFLADQLKTAFGQVVDALNQSEDGQALFAGERATGTAVRVTSLDDLAGALTDDQLFNESVRSATVDLGTGAPLTVADKASTISRDMFDAMRNLYAEMQAGAFGTPLTITQELALRNAVGALDAAHGAIVEAQGRNGDVNNRLDREIARLSSQSTLVTKHISDVADADLAEVAMKLSASQTQYQAIAKVFSDIRELTLLNFLK
jgi:flagellar hook-associated protein 3 FlgL